MRTTTTIDVTQDDIRDGIPFNACHCPIARAVARRLLPGCHVSVGGFISVQSNLNRYAIPLPDGCLTFVRDFDAGKPVQPFAFEMPAWEHVMTQGEL